MYRVTVITDCTIRRNYYSSLFTPENFIFQIRSEPAAYGRSDYQVYILDVGNDISDLLLNINIIKKQGNAGIIAIFIGDIVDQVILLESGIDGLMTQQNSSAELIARIQRLALPNRSGSREIASSTCFNGCRLNLFEMTLTTPTSSSIPLLKNEAIILSELVQQINHTVSRDQLTHSLYQDSDISNRCIDLSISSLRQKMKGALLPSMIKTVYGKGYMLVDESTLY